MKRFDLDDTDVAMITGGVVALASLLILKAEAKTIAMAYLTGLFGIVGLKNKKKGGGLPYGVEG
ncbi:hypothetical protein A3L11_06355 [Thermococcus siculi]|uniref:Uncharacterized protein n=1 Tax=Thermococcus siculi TaxID=72803 RepID=A0A2Z2MSV7_9EURY|nr:hypothetical protein [Thermococcus siculi]ASJ08866.1 hypothetical protein A3L11_06355 [Thermococcus siculi]